MAFKKMLSVAWCEQNAHAETRAYQYISLQHFYMEDMVKAQFYKMKAFHGDLEGPNTLCNKQANIKRLQYKRRMQGGASKHKVKVKKMRQNQRVERTAISKLFTKVISMDDYADLKNTIRTMERGEMPVLKLDDILVKLGYRKVCDRILRVCTPIERSVTENVPSPKHKTYKSAILERPQP